MADSKHSAGDKDYENITDDTANRENKSDVDIHDEKTNNDDDKEDLSQKGMPELLASSSRFRYSAKLSTSLWRSG